MGNAVSKESVPFRFGGRVCLDFVNTVNSRTRPATREYLPHWQALHDWCWQVDLLPAALLEQVENQGAAGPAKARAAHGEALNFRETLYRLFTSVIARQDANARHLQTLNHYAVRAMQMRVFTQHESGFSWRWRTGVPDLSLPIFAVALSAVDLLGDAALHRLKACPGPEGCGWLFFDESKNASRRWCSMDHCGSTAKARRFAARQRGAAKEKPG